MHKWSDSNRKMKINDDYDSDQILIIINLYSTLIDQFTMTIDIFNFNRIKIDLLIDYIN